MTVVNVGIGITNGDFDIFVEPAFDALTAGWELGFGPIDASLSV
jgi:hypothetical protein